MAAKKNIDNILQKWPFDPEHLSVRMVKGRDSRDVIQMRIDMGMLQLEVLGRPDGTRPEGHDTYLGFLLNKSDGSISDMELDEDDFGEIDREFVQFYHRRICWLTLREFERAVQDADHTLALMDFCRDHCEDEQWTMSHEQHRPFVLFHRTQAQALAALEEHGGPGAIEHINEGLENFREFFEKYDVEEHFEEDELVTRLVELRESLREQFEVGLTLEEKLMEAISKEQYELAAELRDELSKRSQGQR
ncbi:MAG: DNA helicase UvrBC [Planctomycetaceae bacterium]|nr:DNA helicase UvrBC [Planctomycetaceae bacterium]